MWSPSHVLGPYRTRCEEREVPNILVSLCQLSHLTPRLRWQPTPPQPYEEAGQADSCLGLRFDDSELHSNRRGVRITLIDAGQETLLHTIENRPGVLVRVALR